MFFKVITNLYTPKILTNHVEELFLFVTSEIEAQLCEKLNAKVYNESTWCEVKLNNKDKLLIGLVYRSPYSVYENNNQLNAMVSSLGNEKHTYVVLLGDFNYKEINW